MKVARLKTPGYYADGGCLYLRIAPGGTKGWIFRFAIAGRTRDAGLGSYPAVSLVNAREEAERRRRLVAAGVDPIEARRKEREAALVATSKAMTFEQRAKTFIAAHEIGWKNDKHRDQWRSTPATYCYPMIGALPVQSIDTGFVLKVLEPIWSKKPETASRVRQRIERVLSWAKVRGYREGENPAQWRCHLDHLLAAKGKVRRVRHHAALPFNELGPLMTKLREETSITARALEFTILTYVRPAPRTEIPRALDNGAADRITLALRLWRQSVPIDGTPAERYFLVERRLPVVGLPLAHAVRWHCRIGAVVVLMTDAVTGEAIGIHRTFLDGAGKKLDRRMLGRQGVIRLSSDDAITNGLGVAEGIEDALAVLVSGWSPVWAATSAGAIARLPVLVAIQSITVFADADKAGLKAAETCCDRWRSAGREAHIAEPT